MSDWMHQFQCKTDPTKPKRRGRKRDLPVARLLRCLDLFDAIEARLPVGALRDELVRACEMPTGDQRETCLRVLLAKMEASCAC